MIPMPEFFKLEAFDGKTFYEAGKQFVDNTYETICSMQDQMEEMAVKWGQQAPFFHPALQKVQTQWLGYLKNEREHVKAAIDQGYSAIGEFWDIKPIKASQKKAPAAKKTTAKSAEPDSSTSKSN